MVSLTASSSANAMPVGAMPARSISLVGTVGLLPTFSPEIVPLNP
jgi:hypothetical protein